MAENNIGRPEPANCKWTQGRHVEKGRLGLDARRQACDKGVWKYGLRVTGRGEDSGAGEFWFRVSV